MAKGAITLLNIPSDIKEYILKIQGIEQVDCLCKKSQEFIIYQLLREHRDMTDLDKTKKTAK